LATIVTMNGNARELPSSRSIASKSARAGWSLGRMRGSGGPVSMLRAGTASASITPVTTSAAITGRRSTARASPLQRPLSAPGGTIW
jgi:hypothetical protein